MRLMLQVRRAKSFSDQITSFLEFLFDRKRKGTQFSQFIIHYFSHNSQFTIQYMLSFNMKSLAPRGTFFLTAPREKESRSP
jgi:hypothetical protein